jgi:hypothetical protein
MQPTVLRVNRAPQEARELRKKVDATDDAYLKQRALVRPSALPSAVAELCPR